ncbi:MAG: hypothetical protein MJ052_02100 [Sphaerochaetaceae bacterium]|nr:hypothetical protein [Sphaerochaetaceae bacterium]
MAGLELIITERAKATKDRVKYNGVIMTRAEREGCIRAGYSKETIRETVKRGDDLLGGFVEPKPYVEKTTTAQPPKEDSEKVSFTEKISAFFNDKAVPFFKRCGKKSTKTFNKCKKGVKNFPKTFTKFVDGIVKSVLNIGFVKRAVLSATAKRVPKATLKVWAKDTSISADNTYNDCADLRSRLEEITERLGSMRLPKKATDEEKEAFKNEKRSLKAEAKSVEKKLSLAEYKGKSLERAADTYAYVLEYFRKEKVNFRRTERFVPYNLVLSGDELDGLIVKLSRAAGKKSKIPAIIRIVVEALMAVIIALIIFGIVKCCASGKVEAPVEEPVAAVSVAEPAAKVEPVKEPAPEPAPVEVPVKEEEPAPVIVEEPAVEDTVSVEEEPVEEPVPAVEEPVKEEPAPAVEEKAEPEPKTTAYNTKTPVVVLDPVKNSRASVVRVSDGNNEIGVYVSPYGTNFSSKYGAGAKISYSHIFTNGFFAGGDFDYFFFKEDSSKKHEFSFTARGGFTFNVGKNNWYIRPQIGAGVNLNNFGRNPAFTAAFGLFTGFAASDTMSVSFGLEAASDILKENADFSLNVYAGVRHLF